MTTTLNGQSLINGEWIEGTEGDIRALDPSTEENLDPVFTLIGPDQLDDATRAAEQAFPEYSATEPEARARFLDRIADNLEALREDVVDRARRETGLTEARLNGELTRTANQLRLFAGVVRSGSFHRVRIDPAQPDRSPFTAVTRARCSMSPRASLNPTRLGCFSASRAMVSAE